MKMLIHLLSRLATADVPVRIRKPVIRIQARGPGIPKPVVQVAEGQPRPGGRIMQPYDVYAARYGSADADY